MTAIITQCPQCFSSFRVAPAQLNAAQGLVRCGACMRVFDAREHATHARLEQGLDVDNTVEQTPIWIKDEIDLENFDLENLDLDEELDKAVHQQQSGRETPAPSAASHLHRPTPEQPAAIPVDRSSPADTGLDERGRDTEPLDLETPDSTGEQLSDLVRAVTYPQDQAAGTPQPDPQAQPGPDASQVPVLRIQDIPLYLPSEPVKAPWIKQLLWSTLILAAIALLGAQYLVYNFDELARQRSTHAYMQKLCAFTGCSIPPLQDLSLIRTRDLILRSHADYADALQMDALLENQADFGQPFPNLQLQFSDINNQPLASRTFAPEEYLQGELAGQQLMPPQTTIHISLEITDPGEHAVNYSLNVRQPAAQ